MQNGLSGQRRGPSALSPSPSESATDAGVIPSLGLLCTDFSEEEFFFFFFKDSAANPLSRT